MLGNNLYVLYGFQNERMEDLKKMNLKTYKWELLQRCSETLSGMKEEMPDMRHNFVFTEYK